jgi:hypothetical protein
MQPTATAAAAAVRHHVVRKVRPELLAAPRTNPNPDNDPKRMAYLGAVKEQGTCP